MDKSSTHAEPSSKSDNNNGDGKNHIPQSGTPSYPSETKSLGDRSAIQTNKITSIELRKLILEKKFSNDVRYQVEGDLSLGGCTGLTALPNWITTIGLTSQGSIRHVCLENSGLSDALIDRMLTIMTPNMQLHFSRSAGQPEQQFSDLEQGFAFWRRLASSNSEIPELDLRYDQADDLVCYLGRLTGTTDYQNQTSRPVLAQRVMAVMSLLAGNDWIRETALRHIHDALSSCDDRIILALDDLETLQLLTSAETLAFENRDLSELKALGLQMMRLDAVKRFVRDHMKTLSWVDAIEVELAFQIGVRQQLDLPGSTQHMIFRGCANVSDQDIASSHPKTLSLEP